MSITIKSNPDGVTGAIQVNGVDKVTIGASGITAGSFAPNSIDAAAAALAFSGANQSLAANGYQKLPSGLIIQWGIGTGSASADVSVTFPIAFPNTTLSISATTDASTVGYFVVTNSVIASNFKFATWSTSTTRAVAIVRWIAIGY